MIFSYGSRRLRTNAFSFCRAAVLANSEISFVDCRLSFGSPVHWRMIFRRASRCFFITSCIGTLLEVDYSGSACHAARHQLAAHDDPALGKIDLFAHLQHFVPTGALDGWQDELGADVALGEVSFVHRPARIPRFQSERL